MFNNGINKFDLSQAQFKKVNQLKAKEKTEKPVEQKVEAQKQQVEQPKVPSRDVLAFLEANPVQNAPKTQAPENVASAESGNTVSTRTYWKNNCKYVITTEYNEKGQEIKTVTEIYNTEGELIELDTRFLEYNEEGQVTKYYGEINKYSDGIATEKIVFEELYAYEKGTYGPDSVNTVLISSIYTNYKYDSQGRVIKEEKTETDADDNITTTTTEYRYDSQGRLSMEESVREDADGNISKSTTVYENTPFGMNKTTTVVNKKGEKAVTKEMQDRRGNVTSKVTYIYDKRGKLIRTIVEVEEKSNKNKFDRTVKPEQVFDFEINNQINTQKFLR